MPRIRRPGHPHSFRPYRSYCSHDHTMNSVTQFPRSSPDESHGSWLRRTTSYTHGPHPLGAVSRVAAQFQPEVCNAPARAFRRFPRDQIWCPLSSYSCKCTRTAQTLETTFQSLSFQSLVHSEMSDNVDEPRPAELPNVNATQQPAKDINWSQLYDMFMKIEQHLPDFDHMLMAMNDYAFQR